MDWRGFGFVHHSRAIFCRAVPNPNLTIRDFSIAVSGEAGECQFDFSGDWLHQQHRSAVATHCWHPKARFPTRSKPYLNPIERSTVPH
jgi:hypothetical protein